MGKENGMPSMTFPPYPFSFTLWYSPIIIPSKSLLTLSYLWRYFSVQMRYLLFCYSSSHTFLLSAYKTSYSLSSELSFKFIFVEPFLMHVSSEAIPFHSHITMYIVLIFLHLFLFISCLSYEAMKMLRSRNGPLVVFLVLCRVPGILWTFKVISKFYLINWLFKISICLFEQRIQVGFTESFDLIYTFPNVLFLLL